MRKKVFVARAHDWYKSMKWMHGFTIWTIIVGTLDTVLHETFTAGYLVFWMSPCILDIHVISMFSQSAHSGNHTNFFWLKIGWVNVKLFRFQVWSVESQFSNSSLDKDQSTHYFEINSDNRTQQRRDKLRVTNFTIREQSFITNVLFSKRYYWYLQCKTMEIHSSHIF